jgi:hypothetical protein
MAQMDADGKAADYTDGADGKAADYTDGADGKAADGADGRRYPFRARIEILTGALAGEHPRYFVGTRCFNSSNQLKTT